MTIVTAIGDLAGGVVGAIAGVLMLRHKSAVTRFFNSAGALQMGKDRANRIYTERNVSIGAWAFVVIGAIASVMGLLRLVL